MNCFQSHRVYAFERDSVHLRLFRGDWRRTERSQLAKELLARESRSLGHKRAGEDVGPERLSYMSGRGVGAMEQAELLEDAVVSESYALVQAEVEKLGLVLLEAVERLDAFEEEETACERPNVSRKHGGGRGADDLRRRVGCRSVDARALVVEVAELDEHLAVRPCEEDVGGAEVAVVHAVCVQVVQAVRDGQGDVELDVKKERLSRGQVLLQRDVHRFHAQVAAFHAEDAHHVRMLRNVQELHGCLHGRVSAGTLELSHRAAICPEEDAGLAALEAGLAVLLQAYDEFRHAFLADLGGFL